ncbi:MAG: hypothetical protein M1834_003704 [Cirrosporium novae-zelandiae]|nr:MAG: hypothetical protein M1834_003704 [Cirrosporium novae-zelandiae]
MDASIPVKEVDALIVGAGLGALSTLQKLRNLGFKVKVYERGAGAGGIWYWNCYPGARVDSDLPLYQLFDEDLYCDWTFTEKFPGWQELRKYFAYVTERWDLNKDIEYNTEVVSADFDESQHKWIVTCQDGSKTKCRWFIPCVGFASKKFIPDYPGLGSFKGKCFHTASWPQEGLDVKGKRVAVIGTGATGVQAIQTTGPEASHLTVYQRTPNLALPMQQGSVDPTSQEKLKTSGEYKRAFLHSRKTFAGFAFDFVDRNCFDDTPEEREAFFESLFEEGGFRFWLANYKDIYHNQATNDECYRFWVKKARARIHDERMKDILAPLDPPHPFGTKRPSLEQHYYEIYNQPNVDLIDLSQTPIEEVTENGIRTSSGFVPLDVLILATGFDSLTGGLTQMDIRGVNENRSVGQHWKNGPQAPTAFSNGPTCVQIQAEWLARVLSDLHTKNITRIEATREAEITWKKKVDDIWADSLFPKAKSWYQGCNIPGKRIEALNWTGGMPGYIENIEGSRNNGYEGFVLDKAGAGAKL